MAGSRLKLVYIAGIALNAVAVVGSAMAGEWVFTGTFVLVVVYLCVRYWMVSGSSEGRS